ncbi:MAG TPA: TrbI/VirB10 family protein [Terriglobales bacterium]|nr:TrbI/VirB10 family protein [Terriglobales bacterium]
MINNARQRDEDQLKKEQKNLSDLLDKQQQQGQTQDPDIPPPTTQQRAAMRSGNPNGTVNEAKQRREKALESSTVVIDFSDSKATAETAITAAPATEKPATAQTKPAGYDFNSATGPTHRIFEGTVLEGVLTNQLDGSFVGPVNVMLSADVYSNNYQQLLLPRGTRILGQAQRVDSLGQQRLAITFHRIICPDGYSISLDKAPGLDQAGSTGIGGKVNNHYAKIFGAAMAIGLLGGLSQINAGYGYGASGQFRAGVTSEFGMEGIRVLDRFLNIMPTITVLRGTRVRIWMMNDLLVPAYDHHTMESNL